MLGLHIDWCLQVSQHSLLEYNLGMFVLVQLNVKNWHDASYKLA